MLIFHFPEQREKKSFKDNEIGWDEAGVGKTLEEFSRCEKCSLNQHSQLWRMRRKKKKEKMMTMSTTQDETYEDEAKREQEHNQSFLKRENVDSIFSVLFSLWQHQQAVQFFRVILDSTENMALRRKESLRCSRWVNKANDGTFTRRNLMMLIFSNFVCLSIDSNMMRSLSWGVENVITLSDVFEKWKLYFSFSTWSSFVLWKENL